MQCVICGCTESTPCTLPDGPCAWALAEPPVCSNPACLLTAAPEIVGAKVSAVEGKVLLELELLGILSGPVSGWLPPDVASEVAEAMSKAAALARLHADDEQQPTLFDAGGAPLEPRLVQP